MRLQQVGAVVFGSVLTLVGCGSYLSDEQLLSANDAEFQAVKGADAPRQAGGEQSAAAPVATGEGGPAPDGGTRGSSSAVAGSPAATATGATGTGTATGRGSGGSAGPATATGAGGSAGGAAANPASGSGGAGGGGNPAPGTGAAPLPGLKSDGSVIKLGSIAVRSGPLGAAMQPAIDAARAWVNDVNARGGLAGHPVELLAVDDRGDPSTALALARRLVEQDGVLAIYGTGMPTTEQAVAPYLQQKGVPIIGGCICNTQVDDSPIVFQVGYGSKKGLAWAQLAPVIDGSDKRKAAVLYCREAQTCSDLRAAIHDWVNNGVPLEIVYEAQISIAQPDFTGEVIQARNAGADVVITLAENPTTIRVARSAHRQNWHPVIATQQGGSDERFIRDGGADVEDTLISHTTASWVNSPLMADYRQAMARYVPGGVRGGMGANVWVAGKLIEKVAEHFPPKPTSADVLNGLYNLRGETLGGRIPPTTYTRGKGNADVNICSVTARIEGGKWIELRGPDIFSCAPGWKPGT